MKIAAVTLRCKDATFVARVLDRSPDALGNVVGAASEAVKEGVKLDLEHAETIMHVSNNCTITLHNSALASSSASYLGAFITNGLFRAAMHVCGTHSHPKVTETAVALLKTLGRDVTAVRKHLVPGKPARVALDAALEASRGGDHGGGGGGGGGRGSALVWKHLYGLVNLADTFASEPENKDPSALSSPSSGGGGGGGGKSNSNMCRVCAKNERMHGVKVTRCAACLKVYYCSKAWTASVFSTSLHRHEALFNL